MLLDAARRYTGSPLHVACRPAGPVSRLFGMAHMQDALHIHANRREAVAAAMLDA